MLWRCWHLYFKHIPSRGGGLLEFALSSHFRKRSDQSGQPSADGESGEADVFDLVGNLLTCQSKKSLFGGIHKMIFIVPRASERR